TPRTSLSREFREIWRARRRHFLLAKRKGAAGASRRISRCPTRAAVDRRYDRSDLVGDQRDRKRLSAARLAGTQDRHRTSGGGVLAGVRASRERNDHARAIAVASGRVGGARSKGRSA